MYKYLGRNEDTESAYEKLFATEEEALQFGFDKIAVYPDYEVIPWGKTANKTDVESEIGARYDIDEELEGMGLDEEGQEGFDWSDESGKAE